MDIMLYMSGFLPELSMGHIQVSISSQLPRLTPWRRTVLPAASTKEVPAAWSGLRDWAEAGAARQASAAIAAVIEDLKNGTIGPPRVRPTRLARGLSSGLC